MTEYLGIITEFLSLLAAVFYYKQLKDTFYVYAIPFLFFICYAEAGSVYIYYLNVSNKIPTPGGNTNINLWISIIETIFYSRFFWETFKNQVLKRITEGMAVGIIASYLFLFFFSSIYVEPYFYLMALNSLWFTTLSCIYFYRLFINAGEDNALSLPDFWMAVGIFAFFSGISLSFVLHKTLKQANIRFNGQSLYNLIPQVLCLILYSCFITAFVLCKKKKTI